MTVNAVSSTSQVQYQQVQARSGSRPPPPLEGAQPFDGGALIDAIASALKEIGATSATDSATSGEAADPAKALGDFLQSLASALHGDNGVNDSSDTSELESAFSNLVNALGLDEASGTSEKLTEFLKALSTNLQGASASGNLINTTA